LYSQFEKSVISVKDLIKREIHYGLITRINRFYYNNLRFPDGDKEIIDILNESYLGNRIKLFKFSKGNTLKPAEFILKLKDKTHGEKFIIRYYGCEYVVNIDKTGVVEII
jgi:hypothetical protein